MILALISREKDTWELAKLTNTKNIEDDILDKVLYFYNFKNTRTLEIALYSTYGITIGKPFFLSSKSFVEMKNLVEIISRHQGSTR